MTSLIASQVAVERQGGAQPAFLHSCPPINYCRSLNTRLPPRPSSLNLSRRGCDTVTPNFENENLSRLGWIPSWNEERGGERRRKERFGNEGKRVIFDLVDLLED